MELLRSYIPTGTWGSESTVYIEKKKKNRKIYTKFKLKAVQLARILSIVAWFLFYSVLKHKSSAYLNKNQVNFFETSWVIPLCVSPSHCTTITQVLPVKCWDNAQILEAGKERKSGSSLHWGLFAQMSCVPFYPPASLTPSARARGYCTFYIFRLFLPFLIAFLLTADAKVCHNCHAPPTGTPTSLIKRIWFMTALGKGEGLPVSVRISIGIGFLPSACWELSSVRVIHVHGQDIPSHPAYFHCNFAPNNNNNNKLIKVIMTGKWLEKAAATAGANPRSLRPKSGTGTGWGWGTGHSANLFSSSTRLGSAGCHKIFHDNQLW